ncbi:MAG: DUF6531 domain-containing protein [Solirubrobacteraceae bacterium]
MLLASPVVLLMLPAVAWGAAAVRSTSPTSLSSQALKTARAKVRAEQAQDAAFSTTLTFSEFPIDTTITNQYEPEGVLFAGPDSSSEPFITTDSANPTSPVLSGAPLFNGDIIGEFVIPGTTTPTSVNGLSVDVGYIDNPGSTQVDVYSASGLTVLTADEIGINTLSTDVPDIYGFKTEEIATEPAGYAIDNLSYTPGTTVAPGLSGTPLASESFGGYNPAEPACQCSFGVQGDPVNTSTGNFSHTWTDVTVPGNGPTLDLARTYNSLATGSAGLFGNGWSFPYDAHLDIAATGDVTVIQGDGAEVPYTETSVGLTAPSRVTATLAQNADGSYTFTTGKQLTYEFGSSGQLTGIADLEGYTTTVTYPSADQLVVTDPSGRTLTFALSDGHIVSATDPDGNVWTYAYNGSDDLTSVKDPLGRTTSYAYDSDGRMMSWTDPRGGTISNEYDAQGRVIQQKDAIGRVTSFDYTSVADGTVVTDRDGERTLYTYGSGVLASETRGYGAKDAATWSYTYDPITGGQATVKDPDGGVTSKTYDPDGDLLTSTDPLGNKTTYTYNSFDELTSTTDPLGTTTSYSYDAGGNLLSKSTPLSGGGTATWSYTYGTGAADGEVVSSTDPDGNATTFGYDAAGDRTSVTDPAGEKTTETYNRDGRRLSNTTANGDTTSYVYDADGELTKATDPLGKGTNYSYDGDGNKTLVTDADGHKTSYTYNADNEQTQVTNPNGSTTKTTYDADGNVLTQTDANGRATTDTYDPLNRVASTTNPDGKKTSYTYDGDGNQLTTVDPSGRTTSYSYDADNHLTAISYSDRTTPNVTERYDADGNRTSMTDGTGTSTFTYDTLGRLTGETNGAGETINYTYDPAGNVTSIKYPNGQTINHAYDDDGRLKSVTDWLGHTTTFGYDGDGNETSESLPGSVTAASTYDADDQLTGITDTNAGGAIATFGYSRDANGQLTASTTSGAVSGKDSYSYDAQDRLTTDNRATYGYDAAGNPTNYGGQPQTFDTADELQASQAPGAGRVAVDSTVTTHKLGKHGTLSALVTAKQPNDLLLAFVSAQGPGGSRQTSTTPKSKGLKWVRVAQNSSRGGIVTIWQAHASRNGRVTVATKIGKPSSQALLTVAVFGPGATVGAHATTTGKRGTPTVKVRTTSSGTVVWGVGHDADSGAVRKPDSGQRLVTHLQSRKNHDASWIQDTTVRKAGAIRIGDRAPASKSWLLAAVAVTPTRIFTYNAEGDRTSVTQDGTTVSLGYDQANQLISVGSQISYAYDGDGLRASKTVDGTTTQFAWDEAGGLPLLLQAGGTYYIYGPAGQPIEQITGSTPTYLLADQQGSARLLTDGSGNVVGSYTYNPWGNVTSHTGTATTNLQYDGQYTDAETGYQYLRARYVDPSTGQFLTVDPAVNRTRARYIEANDSPLTFDDPTGRYAFGLCSFVAASADVGGGVGGEVEECTWWGSFDATTVTPIGSLTVGGGGGVTGGAALDYSSASTPQGLEGPGCSIGASGQVIIGVEGSIGSSCTGSGFNAELGGELGAAGDLNGGISVGYTSVTSSSTGYVTSTVVCSTPFAGIQGSPDEPSSDNPLNGFA